MINQEDMFGKLLPNIYIDKITLESSEISELKVGLELSIKYKRDDDPISLWFSDDKFKKYIKIKVIQSLNPVLTKEITNKTKHVSKITNKQAVIKDLTIDNAVAGTDDLTKYSHTDSDGNDILDVNFKTHFTYDKRNPEHLAYFVFAEIDRKSMEKDYGTLEFDESVRIQNGRISSEIVIDNYKTVGIMTEFYTTGGQRWDGSVHKGREGDREVWITGPSSSNESELLTVERVPNNKIQDFRHVEDIKRYSVDLSVLNKQAFAQNKFRSLKNDNMEPKRKEVYFSDIYLTKDMNNSAKFIFAIDYKKLLMDTSVFKKLYELRTPKVKKLIAHSRIRSLTIKRRRVIEQKTKNKLGTSMMGEVLFDSRSPPETILTSRDSTAAGVFTEVKKDDIGGIKEQAFSILTEGGSSPQQFGIRFFSVFDKTISGITSGLYQYGIEISVEERTAEYLKEQLDKLILSRKNLHAYYLEGTKLGMAKYLAEVSDPHIDHSEEHGSSVTKSSGNYNPVSNRFTEEFILRRADLIKSFDLWIGIETYSDILNLLAPQSMTRDIKNKLFEMITPDAGNPKSVMATIKLFDDLISKLNNLIGLDSDSTTLLSSTTTVEYWFKNNEFDATQPKNIGYDYLSSDVKYAGSDYLRELTTASYLNRIDKESRFYFKSDMVDQINSLDGPSEAYLSPNYCYFPSFGKTSTQVGPLLQWTKHALLASRIMNYNYSRKTDMPQGNTQIDIFRSSISSIYADLGLTIELTDGREIDEIAYPNGIQSSGASATKLYKSLMIGFMKTGANNEKCNENPFINILSSPYVTKKPSEAGIKVWNFKYSTFKWNIFNNSESDIKQILLSCRDKSGYISQRQALLSLPNQLKSLLSTKSENVIWNPHYDPTKDPTTDKRSPFFQFRYNQINAIEYLIGFEDGVGDSRIKYPIWGSLTKRQANSVQGSVMCRMRKFECPVIGIEYPKGLKLPVYDNYFVIKGPTDVKPFTEVAIAAKGPPPKSVSDTFFQRTPTVEQDPETGEETLSGVEKPDRTTVGEMISDFFGSLFS